MPMLERQVRRSYVRTMFRDMTLLAITVLLMQSVSLFFFRDKLRHADPDDQRTYPFVGTEVATFPPGSRFLPSGNYLPVEGLETVQLMSVDGALEVIVLNDQLNPVQQWSLPANVPDSSVAAVDVDDDQLLDLVYTKVWQSLAGVDSLHFCARIADGSEILLDRRIRPPDVQRWSSGYSLPTTPGGCPSSSGINRFVAYYAADIDAAMVHQLLFFSRTRSPELVARIDIANHPGLGYWKRSRRGEEVFLFGGRPDNPSSLLPVQVIAPDGGVQHTLLSGARATLMEISGDGIIRWVRSFPPAPGEVYAFPPVETPCSPYIFVSPWKKNLHPSFPSFRFIPRTARFFSFGPTRIWSSPGLSMHNPPPLSLPEYSLIQTACISFKNMIFGRLPSMMAS